MMNDLTVNGPTLDELDEDSRNAVFDRLQAQMPAVWTAMKRDDARESVVVVPSMTLDRVVTSATGMSQASEERFLFLLLLLRQPRARLVYVTGQAIHPSIVDYYLDLMPGVISSHARKRLFLVSPARRLLAPASRRKASTARGSSSGSGRWSRTRTAPTWSPSRRRGPTARAGDAARAPHVRLRPPPRGPRHEEQRAAAVPRGGRPPPDRPRGPRHRATTSWTRSSACAPSAPTMKRVVDQGERGRVGDRQRPTSSLVGLPPAGSGGRARRRPAGPCPGWASGSSSPASPTRCFPREARRAGRGRGGDGHRREVASPSVQLRVTPLGEVEVLSTHDQLLGGPSGQSFLGSKFPARPEYSALITDQAATIGRRLATEGVLGRFALDFVVARRGSWGSNAIEINLRKGGTTHPYLTLQFLTGGSYDAASGQFATPGGRSKYYVASDHVEGGRISGC